MQYPSAPADRSHFLRTVIYALGFALVAIAIVHTAQASTNSPKPYYGTPFYCGDYNFGGCGLHATVGGAIRGWWAAYKAYWRVNDSNCSYYYTLTGSGGAKKTFALMYVRGTACEGGPSGIYGTLQCPSGYKLKNNTCVSTAPYEVSFLPSTVHIPLTSNVDSKDHHVLTEDVLALNLTKNDNPVSGVVVPLKSSRGTEDTISGEQGTDGFGNDVAFVSTRQQPGTSTITSASSTIETAAPAVISWLPATYEGKFLVTCYAVANEQYQTGGPMVTIPGLPGKYHEQFYKQTRIQGTGLLSNPPIPSMPYIQRDWEKKGNPYKYVTCPRTARGDCAKPGKTIAVDPAIIPMHRKPAVYADVSIGGIGDRTSEDGGNWVNGYHIDLYYGSTWSDYESCLQWGRNGPSHSPHTVTFENYVN